MNPDAPEDSGTFRTETFSDGVFAIAITLLVLEIPHPDTSGGVTLATALWNSWPSFFAVATSFITILILWMNHHNMFKYIRRVDRRSMLLNGLLLLFVAITPFTTALIADYAFSGGEGSRTAAGFYALTFLLLAFVWNGFWRYAAQGRRLLGEDVTPQHVATITRQYYVAPISYTVALAVSFVSGLASVLIIFAAAAFYAITATMGR